MVPRSNHLAYNVCALVADLVAIFVLQVSVLGLLGGILGVLFLLSLFESPAVRKAETFLTGITYGLTAATVLATLFNISIPLT